MCKAKSGVAVYIGGEFKVHSLPGEDAHKKIREEFKIGDGLGAAATRQVPVELIPVRGLFALEDYDFAFDDVRPGWWEEWMTEKASAELFKRWMAEWDGSTLSRGGNLDLDSLTSLPEGVSLKAGGNLYLDSLTSLPEGVKLTAHSIWDGKRWSSVAECMEAHTNK